MRIFKSIITGLLLAAFAIGAWAQQAVAYHIDHAATQGLKGLRNIRNHLVVDATAKITVVTHAEGVDMLMEGAKASNGAEYGPLVSALRARGVVFEVREIILRKRGLQQRRKPTRRLRD